MKWRYEIEWADGGGDVLISTRHTHAQSGDRNLIVYVNEHGHDGRFDEICIPLDKVRQYKVTEVR